MHGLREWKRRKFTDQGVMTIGVLPYFRAECLPKYLAYHELLLGRDQLEDPHSSCLPPSAFDPQSSRHSPAAAPAEFRNYYQTPISRALDCVSSGGAGQGN
jgi:hypothetical protein